MPPSSTERTTGLATAAAGIGLALGAAAIGAFVQTRKAKEAQGDDAPGFTARRGFGKYDVVGRTVTIRRPRAELYAFWRDFQNLARFMDNLEKVQITGGDGRAVWTIKALAGQTVDVETEVVKDVENELIAWRSVAGSDIDTEGRVTFEDAPGERGTRVGLIVAYDPPAGAAGKAVAKLFMREPAIQARRDLKRFKMLMETGEIATNAMRKSESNQAKQEEQA
jgi:uncharacterized membrane protein